MGRAYLAVLASLVMGGCYAQADEQAALRPTSDRSQGSDAGNAAMKARVVELEGRVVRLEDDIRFLLKHDEANAKDLASISDDIGFLLRNKSDRPERPKPATAE
jgi:hypothetical protein